MQASAEGPAVKCRARGITYLLQDTLSPEGDKRLPRLVAERTGTTSVYPVRVLLQAWDFRSSPLLGSFLALRNAILLVKCMLCSQSTNTCLVQIQVFVCLLAYLFNHRLSWRLSGWGSCMGRGSELRIHLELVEEEAKTLLFEALIALGWSSLFLKRRNSWEA